MEVKYVPVTLDESIQSRFITGGGEAKAYLKGDVLEAYFRAEDFKTIDDYLDDICQALGSLLNQALNEFKLTTSEVKRLHIQYVMKDGPMARLLEDYSNCTVIPAMAGPIVILGTFDVLSIGIGVKNSPNAKAKARVLERMGKMISAQDLKPGNNYLDSFLPKADKNGLVRIKNGEISRWRIKVTEIDPTKNLA